MSPRTGANGVQLKKFECVLCDMFSTSPSSDVICQRALNELTPRFHRLPPELSPREKKSLVDRARARWEGRGLLEPSGRLDQSIVVGGAPSPWPFEPATSLPRCGCVRGGGGGASSSADDGRVGNVRSADRAWRKEAQLANMIRCVLALVPEGVRDGSSDSSTALRIVDFAGGTGHLAVPLALLLPDCEVVCVDLKKRSLDLMHSRVDGMVVGEVADHKVHCQSSTLRQSERIPNLYSYHGTIQSYESDFDIGVSLHACGEASDWVLRKCLEQRASWVVCSCCCGKLRRDASNPYVFQSTGANEKQVTYPQSKTFVSLGGGGSKSHTITAEDFDEVAKVSDYSQLGDIRQPKNACRRAAKSLVEWDRLLFTKEATQQLEDATVILAKMDPWEASCKNDILIGWLSSDANPFRNAKPVSDPSCDSDFQIALDHLFGDQSSRGKSGQDQNDWTAKEADEIESQVDEWVRDNKEDYDAVLRFPTRMGSRLRKLIHYTAEVKGLRHWGEGKKESDKTVLVSNRRKAKT